MSKHSDLDYAQHYLILLTDLLAAIEGGRHWPGPMARMAFLCREAKAALSDLMWQDHLDDIRTFAHALFSDEEHACWAKGDLTGVEYLRVQVLKTLNQLSTRLTVLRSRRESDSLAELASAAG
jgi:hypothetical protein